MLSSVFYHCSLNDHLPPKKKKKKKKSENQFSIYIGESELKCMYVCVCISDISIIEQIKYKSIHLKLQEFTPI